MADNIIIGLLIVGGFWGWSLFAYSLMMTICSRKKELEMIDNISKELKKVKEEIKQLK
jgi:hypothetical protein